MLMVVIAYCLEQITNTNCLGFSCNCFSPEIRNNARGFKDLLNVYAKQKTGIIYPSQLKKLDSGINQDLLRPVTEITNCNDVGISGGTESPGRSYGYRSSCSTSGTY